MKKGIKEDKKQREFNKNLGKNMTHGNIKTDFLKKENLRREIKRIQSKSHQL